MTFNLATKIITGENPLGVLDEIKGKRVLIICDAFLAKCDNLSKIKHQLSQANTLSVFADVKPDPTVHDVANGIAELLTFTPDILLAYGGGSAIDQAKAIRYLGDKKGGAVEQLIVIPTTSGTGSEVTRASVISIPEKKAKLPLFDIAMLPDIAILDPQQTVTVPKAVTANTGIDVLTHALEATVSINANNFSDAMAEKAITLVFSHLIECCQNGNNLQSREQMQHASCMAGIAFDHAGLGLNHALAHQIGAHLHLPHGLANALILTRVIEFNCQSLEALKRYARLAKQLGLIQPDQSDEDGATRLVEAIEGLRQAVGIDGDCQRLGVKIPDSETEITAMADAALQDVTLTTNPVTPTQADIIAILKSL